jgi:hypothetical protein
MDVDTRARVVRMAIGNKRAYPVHYRDRLDA